MTQRSLTFIDTLLTEFDYGLRTVAARAPKPNRASPATDKDESELSTSRKSILPD